MEAFDSLPHAGLKRGLLLGCLPGVQLVDELHNDRGDRVDGLMTCETFRLKACNRALAWAIASSDLILDGSMHCGVCLHIGNPGPCRNVMTLRQANTLKFGQSEPRLWVWFDVGIVVRAGHVMANV